MRTREEGAGRLRSRIQGSTPAVHGTDLTSDPFYISVFVFRDSTTDAGDAPTAEPYTWTVFAVQGQKVGYFPESSSFRRDTRPSLPLHRAKPRGVSRARRINLGLDAGVRKGFSYSEEHVAAVIQTPAAFVDTRTSQNPSQRAKLFTGIFETAVIPPLFQGAKLLGFTRPRGMTWDSAHGEGGRMSLLVPIPLLPERRHACLWGPMN